MLDGGLWGDNDEPPTVRRNADGRPCWLRRHLQFHHTNSHLFVISSGFNFNHDYRALLPHINSLGVRINLTRHRNHTKYVPTITPLEISIKFQLFWVCSYILPLRRRRQRRRRAQVILMRRRRSERGSCLKYVLLSFFAFPLVCLLLSVVFTSSSFSYVDSSVFVVVALVLELGPVEEVEDVAVKG
ncbi:hypothetical protein BDN72DRAFT_332374 [Pluteus cervinus]|uniref:Uncharacterized protein n=1 Tax=Pluteus cervinus TaxID=181527 RepID=A0ACD3ACS3_9AGAR|nr:hypothetical protein BDN72DRAFT_332374 [Pluteus cervinus]